MDSSGLTRGAGLCPINSDNDSLFSSRLDLFKPEKIDVSIVNTNRVQYSTLTPFDGTVDAPGRVYSFKVDPQGTSYIDLRSARLVGSWQLVKVVGGEDVNVNASDNMSVVSMVPASLFKLTSCSLNQVEVASNANFLGPLKAYLETLFSYNNTQKATYLSTTQHFLSGATNEDDTVNTVIAGDSTSGFAVRKARFCNNLPQEFEIPINADLFALNYLLIPGVTLRLDLVRSEGNFSLLGASGDSYAIRLKSLKLELTHVTVSDAVANHHASLILKNPLRYHVPQVKMSSQTIPIGVSSTSVNLAQGTLPSLVLVGILQQNQLTSAEKNPFYFGHNNVNSLYFTVNTVMMPSRTYQPNFKDNKSSLREYLDLVQTLNLDDNVNTKEFSYEQFRKGATIFSLNVSKCCLFHRHPVKTGNLELHIGFSEPPSTPLEAIVYSLHTSEITIDKHRIVSYAVH